LINEKNLDKKKKKRNTKKKKLRENEEFDDFFTTILLYIQGTMGYQYRKDKVMVP